MQEFIHKHEAVVIGHLSGWDRVRFMGTLRLLSYVSGMVNWPWTEEDQVILRAVSQGEFAVSGFRNRDLIQGLGLEKLDKRKASSRISRLLRMLRAHGIIRKVSRSNRYLMTLKGRTIASTILQIQAVSLAQLTKAAA